MRLEITRTSDLALRAFRVLAQADRRMSGRDLARAIDTSTSFLSHILPPLVRAGWVSSRPGPDGGYELVVPPGSVSVLAVIEAVEGPMDPEHCVLRGGPCGGVTGGPRCSLHTAWTHARDALSASFAQVPAIGD